MKSSLYIKEHYNYVKRKEKRKRGATNRHK